MERQKEKKERNKEEKYVDKIIIFMAPQSPGVCQKISNVKFSVSRTITHRGSKTYLQ